MKKTQLASATGLLLVVFRSPLLNLQATVTFPWSGRFHPRAWGPHNVNHSASSLLFPSLFLLYLLHLDLRAPDRRIPSAPWRPPFPSSLPFPLPFLCSIWIPARRGRREAQRGRWVGDRRHGGRRGGAYGRRCGAGARPWRSSQRRPRPNPIFFLFLLGCEVFLPLPNSF